MTKIIKGAPALVFHDHKFSIIRRAGEPWIRGQQIAGALGYRQPGKAAADLYRRNAAEFPEHMTAVVKLKTKGGVQDVRIYSLRGAHLFAMFARTDRAAEFRRWALDILDRQAEPPKPAPKVLPSPKPGYHYPRAMLDQPYFVVPSTGKAILSLGMLANTTHFVSPTMALLNQLRSEGNDVSACLEETIMNRTALRPVHDVEPGAGNRPV